jgi:hypothetical protein
MKRTFHHIYLVNKYALNIVSHNPRYVQLVINTINHDASKFTYAELEGYIFINEKYKASREGREFNPGPRIEQIMGDASTHHVTSNKHHPEFFGGLGDGKLPINAQEMDDISLAEMVADWCAMSDELVNSPFEWAASFINKKASFSDDQVNKIYKLMKMAWNQ